jgi:hypothetical protein
LLRRAAQREVGRHGDRQRDAAVAERPAGSPPAASGVPPFLVGIEAGARADEEEPESASVQLEMSSGTTRRRRSALGVIDGTKLVP